MSKQWLKLPLTIIASLVLAVSNSTVILARDAMFRAQNDVLYYGEEQCSEEGGTPTASTGDGGGCGSKTDMDANKKQIWSFLKSKGLNDAGAAGIMGNAEQESSFNPSATNGIGCRGFVQWCFERNSKLDSFAKERGKSWDCLGLQLEYLWYEMTETTQGQVNANGDKLEIPLVDALNGKDFSRKSNYNRSAPYNAGAIFHDYFERANTAAGENLGRGERAEKIYKEFTGKDAGPVQVSNSTGSGSSTTTTCQGAKETDTSIPPAECGALVEEVKKLRAEGKFKSINGTANLDKDLANCTSDPIECGTGAGKGGVTPELLRAFVAVVKHIDSKGLGQIDIASMNTGHPCDPAMHPKGKAVDFWNCYNLDTDAKCGEIFKYITDNATQLGIRQVIHDVPPSGYQCSQGPILCLNDHYNEIHMGL